MKGDQERPYYGYGANRYIIGALAAAGTVCVVLAIALNTSGHSTSIVFTTASLNNWKRSGTAEAR